MSQLHPGKGLIAIIVACLQVGGCGAQKDGQGDAWDSGVDGAPDGTSDVAADPVTDPVYDVLHDPTLDVEEEPCFATEVSAEHGMAPVDIIWVVDSSGSMDFENRQVQDNLNAFSSHIFSSGVEDYHVILIGDAGEMSVPPPLGGGPNFMHIDDSVGSDEALEKLLFHYPTYKDFLRPGAVRHFVAVTDDESDLDWDDFVSALGDLTDPGFPPYDWSASEYGFQFHSICAFGTIPIIGCVTGAGIGHQYIRLSDETGGVKMQVCLTDWSPIFSALESAIGVVTVLPCAYDIPDPPEGETFNKDKVNVNYYPSGGGEVVIPRVTDPTACVEYGWFYDDYDDPATIHLCPDTCTIVQADTSGRVSIAFGCDTLLI
jgi:hypothetical protein